MLPRQARASALALAGLAVAFVLGGCLRIGPPGRPTPPPASSPVAAVQRFAWSWRNRDAAEYGALLTADFIFQFAPYDSAGNPWKGSPWIYELEMACVQHLFVGGGVLPPAKSLSLSMADTLLAMPDPRPGMDPGWHKVVRAPLSMVVTTISGGRTSVTEAQGYAVFYLVRGDSAFIPPAVVASGGGSRSNWYIQRWEEEAVPAATGGHGNPSPGLTVGELKARYLP